MGPAAEPGTVDITVDPSSRPRLGVVTCLPQSPRVAASTPDQWDKNTPAQGFLEPEELRPRTQDLLSLQGPQLTGLRYPLGVLARF